MMSAHEIVLLCEDDRDETFSVRFLLEKKKKAWLGANRGRCLNVDEKKQRQLDDDERRKEAKMFECRKREEIDPAAVPPLYRREVGA